MADTVVALSVAAVAVLVAASRVYRGMHHLTDVLTGALAAGIWLTVVLLVLLPARRRSSR